MDDRPPKSIEEHQEEFKNAPLAAQKVRRAGKTLLSHAQVEALLAEVRVARKPSKTHLRKPDHKIRIAELCKRSVAR